MVAYFSNCGIQIVAQATEILTNRSKKKKTIQCNFDVYFFLYYVSQIVHIFVLSVWQQAMVFFPSLSKTFTHIFFLTIYFPKLSLVNWNAMCTQICCATLAFKWKVRRIRKSKWRFFFMLDWDTTKTNHSSYLNSDWDAVDDMMMENDDNNDNSNRSSKCILHIMNAHFL